MTVIDRSRTQSLGISGVLFTVTPHTGGLSATVGLDYSGFAEAYGGGYGGRLRLVRLPACALTTPQLPACRTATPLNSRNDLANRSVSVPMSLGDAGTVTLLAATSTDPGTEGGAGGTYAATDLKPSGSWAEGGSSGSFTWSYPVVVPPATAGPVPDVSLSYDSGSVDGQTASTQAQASWVGDGWSTPSSFIEQSFTSCSDKPEGTAAPVSTNDQCYDGPILTMSLRGSSTSLVYQSGTWRPEKDDGSVVTHVTNSSNGTTTHDRDYWTVTTRDGAVYSFGRNRLPGWTSTKAETNSVDTVPVYSAHTGDPCYNSAGFSSSWCTMAYRWNLDFVSDVHGNAMSLYYKQDTNYYGRYNGATMTSYVRNSYLDHIDYGFTDADAYVTVPNQVVFGTGPRCVSGTCTPLSSSTKANWPDVPYDLVCASGSTCASGGPSFFSTVRLTSITTQQYATASSSYQPVDTYALTQTIPATGDQSIPSGSSVAPTLWLASVTRTAAADSAAHATSALSLPAVRFDGTQLQNRADTVTDGLPPLYRYRLTSITTETGSVITVNYGQPDPCPSPTTITKSANTTSCFPVSWTPSGYTAPIFDWFNKYAVTSVSATDPTGGAPATLTNYSYLGGAAWHFDDNELVKAKYRTYGQFRGYQTVRTLQGNPDMDRQTLSETTYYRGMSKNNNTTVVNVTDSAGGTHEDLDELAGLTLESTAYKGNGGSVDHSTVTSYWVSGARATRTRTGLPDLTAKLVAPVETYTRQALTASGSTTWRYTETDTAYDTNVSSATFGVEKVSYSHTVPVNTAYDQCTSTSYAPVNTTRNLVGLVAEQETDTVACGGFTQGSPASVPSGSTSLTDPSTVSRPSQVVSDTRTFYDDTTWSTTFPQASVSKGDATMVRKATTWTSGAFVHQTTERTAYDSRGRVTDSYDGNANHTVTGYTDNSVGLTTATSTTNPLGQGSSTTVDPVRGQTLTSTDINNVVATRWYDALGRTTSVWQYSRATTSPANYTFAYQLSNTGVSAVTTQTLNDNGGYVTSTKILDAQLRVRQTQQMTPNLGGAGSGRLVTDTFYDTRGWVASTNNGWWDPATTPNTTLIAPAQVTPPPQIPEQHSFTYDGLGRTVQDISQRNSQTVTTTTTVYNGDRSTVVPPTGGIVTTTITDPLGRTSESDTYSARPTLTTPADTFTGTFTVSGGTSTPVTYGFDGHGNQSTVTEPGPHTWTSTFDNLLGLPTSKTDPDAGTTHDLKYDGNDNLTEATDARGKVVSSTYDALDRRTGQYAAARSAQSSSNQLAKWVYDNSDGSITGMTYPNGHLTSATTWWNGNAYTSQYNKFNIFGRSLGETVTIPAAEGTLAGSYTYTHIYTPTTGLPLKDMYTAHGGLPAETLLRGYTTALDQPNTLTGLTGYAQGVSYDSRGHIAQEVVGSASSNVDVTNTWDDHTGLLTDQLVTGNSGTIDQQHYGYDLVGNVQQQKDTRNGSTASSETQCYQYNGLNQLTEAWTGTDDCASAPTTANHTMVGDPLGAASAYWTSWSVDTLGWSSRTLHSLTGGTDTTTNYTYDGNGAAQPHTLTATSGGATGATSYHYDASGNMTNRSAGQGNQNLTWDDAGRLTTISGGTAGTSTMLYDADGKLLLQKDSGRTTLYLPTEQLTLNTATNTTTGTRYYALPGGGQAVRTGTATSAYSFAIGDRQGSPTLYLDNTAQTPSWRQYGPYGEARGAAVTPPDNHGFLNKPVNTDTGLTHLDAREYDPTVGRFISPDPVLDFADITQTGGYAYVGSSPITREDPNGLCALGPDDHCGGSTPKPKPPTPPSSGCHSDSACDHHRENPTPPPSTGCHSDSACGHHHDNPTTPPSTCHSASSCDHRVGGGPKRRGPIRGTTSGYAYTNYPPPDIACVVSTNPGMCSMVSAWLSGKGTVGLCVNAGVAFAVNFSGEVCMQHDQKGLFFTATGATPPLNSTGDDSNASFGLGAGVGAKFEVSDARDKNGLGGAFKYGEGSAGPVQDGYAWGTYNGEDVHMYSDGVAAGSVSGSGGVSNTAVSGYFPWLEGPGGRLVDRWLQP